MASEPGEENADVFPGLLLRGEETAYPLIVFQRQFVGNDMVAGAVGDDQLSAGVRLIPQIRIIC